MTKDQLFQHISGILVETFDIPAAQIVPEATLGGDLDIDSIDAIDLIVRLKPLLGNSLSADAFRTVRTLQDVVDVLHTMMQAKSTTDAGN